MKYAFMPGAVASVLAKRGWAVSLNEVRVASSCLSEGVTISVNGIFGVLVWCLVKKRAEGGSMRKKDWFPQIEELVTALYTQFDPTISLR
jgi:hypothetical protein